MDDVPLCDLCFEEATCEMNGAYLCDAHAERASGDGDSSQLA